MSPTLTAWYVIQDLEKILDHHLFIADHAHISLLNISVKNVIKLFIVHLSLVKEISVLGNVEQGGRAVEM